MIYEPIWGAIIAWYLFLAGLGGGAFATAVFVRYRHQDCKRLMRVGRLIAPIVMSLVSGNWAVAFWLLFVIVGLVLPTILECWMLWLAKHEFETSRTGQMISALSDAGVLVGGFMLRLLIVSAAVPITIVQPWML